MSLTISARFVLGTYQGRSPSGTPEPFPETDRLFSAFVAAAGAGPYAEHTEAGLRIAAPYRRALEWLESTPPDRLAVPDHNLNTPGVTAYRLSGLLDRGNYSSPVAKDALARSSLAGPVSWRWDTEPSPEIVAALRELAAEVAYIGEANSTVVVDVSQGDDPLADELEKVGSGEPFPTASVPISTPQPGRLTALEAAHASLRPPKPPSDGKIALGEAERVAIRPGDALALTWYRRAVKQLGSTFMPWDGVIVLEAKPEDPGMAWPPKPTDRLKWAVALHRAMSKALSPESPPLLTGRYSEEAAVPANRVAIQLINRKDPLGWQMSGGTEAAFALFVPSDAGSMDRDALVRVAHLLSGQRIYIGRAGAVRISHVRFIEGSEFWRPRPDGTQRIWAISPLAIAETRSQRGKDGRSWGLTEAALLSVGMVWRDALGLEGRGSAFYTRLVEAARGQATVLAPKQVVGQNLTQFVHKTKPSNVVTGYTGWLRFTDVVHPRGPLAIGQSRHLGTGLLIPIDVPSSLLDEEGSGPWS